jgi:predicted nucleotidyltransferase
MLDLPAKYLVLIRGILADAFNDTPSKVFLFGSRATGRARPASDVDLAVESLVDLQRQIAVAAAAFEESCLPFTVDLVNLARVSEPFRRAVEKEGKLIWKN